MSSWAPYPLNRTLYLWQRVSYDRCPSNTSSTSKNFSSISVLLSLRQSPSVEGGDASPPPELKGTIQVCEDSPWKKGEV